MIEWRDKRVGFGYLHEYSQSRDKHWVVHPTPRDPFAPYGVFRDDEWVGGAVSLDAGKTCAETLHADSTLS